jgi:phosphate starvation-inducible PhoH-like protein
MRSSFLQDDIFPSKKKKLSELRSLAPVYKPKSENQKQYVDYLTDATVPIVLGIGPAGCGKTLFACTTAIHELRSGNIKKIVLTRPIVPVEEEELGFLPGSLVNKMDPWTRPIFDIFLEFYQQKDMEAMIHSGVIEISPLAYMRGRTFKSAYIIADEMQNSTPNQMLMLTTRIGAGSKMVITGDLKQSDRSASNGLLDIMTKIREQTQVDSNFPIKMVEMNYSDIERSPIVSTILAMYQKKVGSVKSKPKAVDMDAALIPLSHMEKGL